MTRHVFGQAGGDNDDVISRFGQGFYPKVDKSSEDRILALEQLGDGKEALRGLPGGQGFPRVDHEQELGQDGAAFSRIDWGLMEDPGLL